MVWWNKCEVQKDFNKVVNVNSKIVGKGLCSVSELHERREIAKRIKIIGNTSQILASQYEILQSGQRYRVPLCSKQYWENQALFQYLSSF